MENTFIIILVGICILFSIYEFIFKFKMSRFGICIISLMFGFCFHGLYTSDKPQAIDVYKGKTELKIDYNNGKADTIVVWKTLID